MEIELITREPKDKTDAKSTPLMFIHGAWHAAWCWDEYFLPYFAEKGYTSYALSFRGHGKSTPLTTNQLRLTRIKHYVEDLAQVVAKLPAPPVLIGHSMGGLVTQKYLENHEAPAAILLGSVPAHGAIFATLRTMMREPLAFLKTNLALRLYPVIGTEENARMILFSETMPSEKVRDYQNRLQDESYLGYMGMILLELPRTSKIKTPMLVLAGDKDAIFSVWEERRTAHTYHADFVVLPETPHDAILESNWQSTADIILRWLDERGL